MAIVIEAFSLSRRDQRAATSFRVALLVSLVIHAAAFWEVVPKLRLAMPDPSDKDAADARLTVRLAPPPAPPPVAQAPPAPRVRARPAPPVVALDRPAPGPAAPPAAAAPARPAEPDLMAYVEARRRIRGEAAAAAASAPGATRESDNDRASRIATANLASPRTQVFGYDPSKSGGVFQVERLTSDYAEFTFAGWNSELRRRTKQLIEVRKGDNSDIRVAVVRSMIAIIRQYDPVEFTWDSQRLGRSLTLSSRMRDNAGLEDFMMQEFFSGPGAAGR